MNPDTDMLIEAELEAAIESARRAISRAIHDLAEAL